jgi:hypothetical protein
MKIRIKTLSVLFFASLPWLAPVSSLHGQPYGYGYGDYGQPRTAKPMASGEASITIKTPHDGATLSAGQPVTLQYRIDPGPRGDHIHVYVDGREVAILRQLQGSYVVERLSPGPHELGIKIVNSAHVPIGVESSVSVEAK